MTLSRVKMARELGKQDARIGECLSELARAGLIRCGLVGEETRVISSEEFDWLAYDCKYLPKLEGNVAASWWGARSCQKKRTLFYRLLALPEEVLPPFQPFANGSSAGSTSGQEQHGVVVSENDRNGSEVTGPVAANNGNDQISRAWNDPGRNVRLVQKELELYQKDVGSTQNDLNRMRMTSERGENYQQVVPRSFRSPSSLCSNVLNDDDVDDADDEELTRSREYNSGTIKTKTTQSQYQTSTSRPVTSKYNPSQTQSQAKEQEEWPRGEEEQGEGQEKAEEPAREEVVSEPENDKRASSERLQSSRLQEEITALRRSPLHCVLFSRSSTSPCS
jgi:hypothetical protein